MISLCDPAKLPQASCTHEHETLEAHCHNCGKAGDAICPHCRTEYRPDSTIEAGSHRQIAGGDVLAKCAALARFIQGKRNSKFWWGCFLIATGDAEADGVSMEDYGAAWSVGRACVSKTCVEICVRLGIPPSRYMRTEEARESYRKSNRRNAK